MDEMNEKDQQQPIDPQPQAPAEPVEPAQPAAPAEPAQPAAPQQPQTPQQPAAPQQPQAPQQPYQPQAPQAPYGYPQQPAAPQQPYGYPQQPQQPYGYPQQPQQPYGYPQQPQAPQQPYGYPQQQPYYPPQQPYYPPQPQAPVAVPATPAEKNAFFSAAGSVFMLIFCIVSTLSLVTGLVGDILSFDFGSILLIVLDILMVIGLWITFANAKKQKIATNGISLIKVPYTIQFVFTCIGFGFNVIIWIATLNVISLLVGILSFVFTAICYSSVKKTLVMAKEINLHHSVRGRKAGSFAAIMMIISGALELAGTIVGQLTLAAITAMLEELGMEGLAFLLGGASTVVYVVAAVAFLAKISGAIVLLQFGKKIKAANG